MEPGEPRGLPVLKLVVAPFFVDVGRDSRPSYLLRVTVGVPASLLTVAITFFHPGGCNV